jgi:hypothetical protein
VLSLDNCQILNDCLKLYCPITTDNHIEQLDKLKTKLIEITGGLTSYIAKGQWVNNGVLVSDEVEVIEVWFNASPVVLAHINNLFSTWGIRTGEKALAYSFNNTFTIEHIGKQLVEAKAEVN